MIKMKGRKGKPCLGTHMESENQRGRWEESSNLDRKVRTFLNFLVWFDFIFDTLGYSSADSLVSSEATSAKEVRL